MLRYICDFIAINWECILMSVSGDAYNGVQKALSSDGYKGLHKVVAA